MNFRRSLLLAAATLPAGVGAATPASPREALIAQLQAAETAFADTMARRDLAAFGTHLSPDAVFIDGGGALRGPEAILAHWSRYFAAGPAPFAWRPEVVEVSGDGQLGYTEGPVTTPDGATVARFFSTWRRGPDGRWLVVFDHGTRVCQAA